MVQESQHAMETPQGDVNLRIYRSIPGNRPKKTVRYLQKCAKNKPPTELLVGCERLCSLKNGGSFKLHDNLIWLWLKMIGPEHLSAIAIRSSFIILGIPI